jgi:hypothetical protein
MANAIGIRVEICKQALVSGNKNGRNNFLVIGKIVMDIDSNAFIEAIAPKANA